MDGKNSIVDNFVPYKINQILLEIAKPEQFRQSEMPLLDSNRVEQSRWDTTLDLGVHIPCEDAGRYGPWAPMNQAAKTTRYVRGETIKKA